MRILVREHRSGQRQAEVLAGELRRATLLQLRGRTGQRLARELQQYVRAARAHMRREEAVFYSGSERVLRASDWAALMDGPQQRDPATDLQRLASRYPRLAEQLQRPERAIGGIGENPERRAGGFRQCAERVVERTAMLAHGALDVVRSLAKKV